jgi:hypothetical protein
VVPLLLLLAALGAALDPALCTKVTVSGCHDKSSVASKVNGDYDLFVPDAAFDSFSGVCHADDVEVAHQYKHTESGRILMKFLDTSTWGVVSVCGSSIRWVEGEAGDYPFVDTAEDWQCKLIDDPTPVSVTCAEYGETSATDSAATNSSCPEGDFLPADKPPEATHDLASCVACPAEKEFSPEFSVGEDSCKDPAACVRVSVSLGESCVGVGVADFNGEYDIIEAGCGDRRGDGPQTFYNHESGGWLYKKPESETDLYTDVWSLGHECGLDGDSLHGVAGADSFELTGVASVGEVATEYQYWITDHPFMSTGTSWYCVDKAEFVPISIECSA